MSRGDVYLIELHQSAVMSRIWKNGVLQEYVTFISASADVNGDTELTIRVSPNELRIVAIDVEPKKETA